VYGSLAWIKAIQMKIGKISNLRSSRRIKVALDENKAHERRKVKGRTADTGQ